MSTAPHADALSDVAIVGGGITGLAAAWELQRRGLSVRLLEATPRLGGVIRTERFDGWVVDAGPDSLLVQKPAAVALCRELGLGDRLISTLTPRTAYILREGVLHPIVEGSFLGFPIRFRSLARSSLFTWGGRIRMAAEVLVPRGGGEDESIAAFVRRRFGDEAAEYLAEPLLAGIHAGDAERLSMQALFPRLIEAERQSGSVLRAFRQLKMRPSPQGAFASLPGGIGELVDALAAALRPGTVQLSARVGELRRAGTAGPPGVDPDARGTRPAYSVESDAGTTRARAIIICTPAYVTAHLLRALDTTLAGLCDGVPYASTATVAFGYRREHVPHTMQGTGFVVPRAEHPSLLAATWVSSKWPGRAPEGHALMRAFLGGGRDPHRLDRPDEELVEAARAALEDLMGITAPPLFARLFRWTRQSPQYEVGHRQRVAAIDQRLAAIPGLFVAGSGFRAIGIPDCIADGREMAARAAEYVTQSRP